MRPVLTAMISGMLLGICSLVIFRLVQYSFLYKILNPGQSWLDFEPVKLGQLHPGENKKFAVLLRNTSWRPLSLMPPQTDCGCISLQSGSIQIAGHESTSLVFDIRAPDFPGELKKRITLTSSTYPTLVWHVPVTAWVEAPIWSQPPQISVDYGPEDTAVAAKLAIHHSPVVKVGMVESTSPVVTIRKIDRTDGLLNIEVEFMPGSQKDVDSGDALLQAFDREKSVELLRVPVSWRRRPDLALVPQSVSLTKKGSTERVLWNVIVFRGSGLLQDPEIEPLFPWVRLQSKRPLSGGLVLQFSFDRRAMPDQLEGDIVRFRHTPGSPPVYLHASVGP